MDADLSPNHNHNKQNNNDSIIPKNHNKQNNNNFNQISMFVTKGSMQYSSHNKYQSKSLSAPPTRIPFQLFCNNYTEQFPAFKPYGNIPSHSPPHSKNRSPSHNSLNILSINSSKSNCHSDGISSNNNNNSDDMRTKSTSLSSKCLSNRFVTPKQNRNIINLADSNDIANSNQNSPFVTSNSNDISNSKQPKATTVTPKSSVRSNVPEPPESPPSNMKNNVPSPLPNRRNNEQMIECTKTNHQGPDLQVWVSMGKRRIITEIDNLKQVMQATDFPLPISNMIASHEDFLYKYNSFHQRKQRLSEYRAKELLTFICMNLCYVCDDCNVYLRCAKCGAWVHGYHWDISPQDSPKHQDWICSICNPNNQPWAAMLKYPESSD